MSVTQKIRRAFGGTNTTLGKYPEHAGGDAAQRDDRALLKREPELMQAWIVARDADIVGTAQFERGEITELALTILRNKACAAGDARNAVDMAVQRLRNYALNEDQIADLQRYRGRRMHAGRTQHDCQMDLESAERSLHLAKAKVGRLALVRGYGETDDWNDEDVEAIDHESSDFRRFVSKQSHDEAMTEACKVEAEKQRAVNAAREYLAEVTQEVAKIHEAIKQIHDDVIARALAE